MKINPDHKTWLARLHPGQWFYWESGKEHTYANMKVRDHKKPTQKQIEEGTDKMFQEDKQREVQGQRRSAYERESDPLFFKWQRGEATEQAWKDKVAEIKERYPNPD